MIDPKLKEYTLRDTNTTENGKVGLQPVATLLHRFLSCWCLAKFTFLRSQISPCSYCMFVCLFVCFFPLIRSLAEELDGGVVGRWRKTHRGGEGGEH